MMENTAIILIVVSLFLLVIILGLLTALIFKLMKQIPSSSESAPLNPVEFHPAIVERMKALEKVGPKKSELFCPFHSEEPGEVMCAVCDKLYCRSCIKSFKTMHFCKEHLALIMRHDWEEVLTIKTSTSDPEQGVRLYDLKKVLFENDDIPTYVETHYKINVDQDYIETYLVLFAIKEQVMLVKEKFQDVQI